MLWLQEDVVFWWGGALGSMALRWDNRASGFPGGWSLVARNGR